MKGYAFWFFLLIALSVKGQEITGKVVDASSNPIPYANVVLMSKSDSVMINGVATNEEGVFILKEKPETSSLNTIIRISSIGFNDLFLLPKPDLGVVSMSENTLMLNEFVVKGKRDVFSVKEGKISANVQNTILEHLGSATQLLSQLPFVNEANGSFSVFGRGTPIIYIDNQRIRNTDELRRLSSKDIKNVELLLGPGGTV